MITYTNLKLFTFLKKIKQKNLQVGNGSAFCRFEFTKKKSDTDSIKCDLKIDQEENYDMMMAIEHIISCDKPTSKYK